MVFDPNDLEETEESEEEADDDNERLNFTQMRKKFMGKDCIIFIVIEKLLHLLEKKVKNKNQERSPR